MVFFYSGGSEQYFHGFNQIVSGRNGKVSLHNSICFIEFVWRNQISHHRRKDLKRIHSGDFRQNTLDFKLS